MRHVIAVALISLAMSSSAQADDGATGRLRVPQVPQEIHEILHEILQHIQRGDNAIAPARKCIRASWLKKTNQLGKMDRPLHVRIMLRFKEDGILAEKPKVLDPYLAQAKFGHLTAAAVEAVEECVPIKPMPTAPYEDWKWVIIDLAPDGEGN